MTYAPNVALAPRGRVALGVVRYRLSLDGIRLVRCRCGATTSLTPRDRIRRHHSWNRDADWSVCELSGAQAESTQCDGQLVRDGWNVKLVPVPA